MRIAVLGTGSMGNGIAANLLAHGHTLRIHDVDDAAMQNLVEAGAVAPGNVIDAARSSEVVFMSLPAASIVEQVADAALEGTAAGGVLVDLSTSPPSLARRLAERAAVRDIAFLDAPVSGGQVGARRGTLSTMIGGEAEVVEKCRPVFEAFADNIFHVGEVGSGQVVKLVNNMMLYAHQWSMIEGLAVGVKAGVDPNVLRQVIRTSTGNSWSWAGGTKAILKDLPATVDMHIVEKDLTLALDLAAELDVPTAMTTLAKQLTDHYMTDGFADTDILHTLAAMEKRLGISIRGQWHDPGENE